MAGRSRKKLHNMLHSANRFRDTSELYGPTPICFLRTGIKSFGYCHTCVLFQKALLHLLDSQALYFKRSECGQENVQAWLQIKKEVTLRDL